MKASRAAAVLLLVWAGGCLGPPDVPADAVSAVDEELPGLRMHAWTEDAERVRMHGVLVNEGTSSYDIHVGCGRPWNSTIIAPDGTEVPYRQVMEEPNCPVLWDVMRPKAHLDVLYSWDFQAHDVEHDVHEPVPAGNYTWVLQVGLRDRPQVLETRIPITVA